MSNKLKIFVSAYACEPNLGSEIGVGWHWVIEMSKYFDLWVLTRKSNKNSIEKWIDDNPEYKNITFIYFDLPHYLRFWKRGMRGVRTYYNIWQILTEKIVKKTMIENDIEIFHHLTYGNMLWRVSKFGQKQFFIWGPTGGVEMISSDFSKHYKLKGKLIELFRRNLIKLLPYNNGFKNRCKNANLILCKTERSKSQVPSKYSDKAILFTDVATEPLEIDFQKKQIDSEIIKYVVVGKLDPWRGFDLLIEAFNLALKDNKKIHLKILGDGSDWDRLNQLIQDRNLQNNITMLGKVSMNEYYKTMRESDVVVNPGLKEAAVTTSFDAMSMGKPMICVDTTGYTRYFSKEYALILPITTRKELIENLRDSILKLTEYELRFEMGKKAMAAGKRFTWEARGKEIQETILKAFESYKNV